MSAGGVCLRGCLSEGGVCLHGGCTPPDREAAFVNMDIIHMTLKFSLITLLKLSINLNLHTAKFPTSEYSDCPKGTSCISNTVADPGFLRGGGVN